MGGNPRRWVRSLMFFENRMNATIKKLLDALPGEVLNRYATINPPPQGSLKEELVWRAKKEKKEQLAFFTAIAYAILYVIITAEILKGITEERISFGWMMFVLLGIVPVPIIFQATGLDGKLRESNEWFDRFLKDAQYIHLETCSNYEIGSVRTVTEEHLVQLAARVIYQEWVLEEAKRFGKSPEILMAACDQLIKSRERFNETLRITEAFNLATRATRGYYNMAGAKGQQLIDAHRQVKV